MTIAKKDINKITTSEGINTLKLEPEAARQPDPNTNDNTGNVKMWASLASGALSALGSLGGSGQRRDRDNKAWWASNQIAMRVGDAKRSGIHPLYALGMQGTPYNAQTVSDGSNNWQNMGQALSAGLQEYQHQKQMKAQKSTRNLQNQHIQAQINETEARTRKIDSEIQKDFAQMQGYSSLQNNQASQALGIGKPRSTDQALKTPLGNFMVEPGLSTAQDVSDRYDDILSNVYGAGLFLNDLGYHSKKKIKAIVNKARKQSQPYKKRSTPWYNRKFNAM